MILSICYLQGFDETSLPHYYNWFLYTFYLPLSFFVDTYVTLLYFFIAAVTLFKLLEKYRPETSIQKKERLKARAESKVAKKQDTPTKRPNVIRAGVNTVTTLVEQKKAQLVVIAHDVDPITVRILTSLLYFFN